MSLTNEEREACLEDLRVFMEDRRPPPEVRDRVDLRYRWEGKSLILCEVRPAWDGRGDVIERPLAKLTYLRTRDAWKLYWRRANGKWQSFEPAEYPSLEDALSVVRWDDFGCFFG